MSRDDIDYTDIEPEERARHLDQPEPAAEETVTRFDQAGSVPELAVTDEMLRNDTERADSWLVYNKGLGQTGFSPATELGPETVGSLSQSYALSTEGRGLETNPIVVPSDPPVMYYTVGGAWRVVAANARTGERLWEFQAGIEEPARNVGFPVDRGVAVRGDTVYFGIPASSIVALDRYTGEKRWETDLVRDDQNRSRIFLTQAPVAYDGRVYVGQSSDYAQYTTVSAVDAESGEVAWQHRTAPRDEWVGETWKFSSNAAWMSPTVDPQTNTVFFAVGNPVPMLNGLVRPGPNRDACSLVAVDGPSGRIRWKRQISPHDLWDHDVHATPRVYDLNVDGERRRVVATIWKAGWIYVFGVETGELIARSPPLTEQGGDAFLSLPGAGEDEAEEMFPPMEGATEWPPDSYSPQTGLHYVGTIDAGQNVWYDPDWAYDASGREGFAYGGGALPISDHENTAKVKAIDATGQRVAWEHELEDVDSGWPAVRLFTGGTTSTAGKVVFHGSSGGDLLALHAETGDVLWRDDTGSRITASPVVWTDPATGDQRVTVAAGSEVLTYSGSG